MNRNLSTKRVEEEEEDDYEDILFEDEIEETPPEPLSKRRARAHGGEVTVQSEDGKGSNITASLPLYDKSQRPIELLLNKLSSLYLCPFKSLSSLETLSFAKSPRT